MSGINIITDYAHLSNGCAHIPNNDNRILIRTTKQFYLGTFRVPAGSIGKIVDTVCDGQVHLIDFGLPIVARIRPGSPLIEPVTLADLLTQFEAELTDLAERMEAGR
jgi:hypothetical protein